MKPDSIFKSKPINADHPQYEKKIKVSFIIKIIIGLVIGGIAGYISAYTLDHNQDTLTHLGKLLTGSTSFMQYSVFPALYLLFTVFFVAYITYHTRKMKMQIQAWDREDDAYINQIDLKLSKALTSSSSMIIISSILFAITTYNLLRIDNKKNLIGVGIVLSLYFFNFIYAGIQQNRIVKLNREYSPEKKGCVYDSKFSDVYFDSCDEAERYMIYECTYKTFRFMNNFISGLFFVVCFLGMFAPIGIQCSLVVGSIWLVMNLYYSRAALKIEHPVQE